jgi:hypothetical protein
MAAGAAAMSGIIMARWLTGPNQTNLEKIGVALAAILAGGVCYLAIQWIRSSEEMRHLYAGTLTGHVFRKTHEMKGKTDTSSDAPATKSPP